MFTGIIESVGQITSINDNHGDFEIKIKYDSTRLNDISLGESISINGICLTVTKFDNNFLHFDLSKETISRISKFRINEIVNIETSLRVNSKISGHFVFGHVDGLSKIKRITKVGQSWIFLIESGVNITKYLSSKCSISLDGVSLTVISKNTESFSVSLVEWTQQNTNLLMRENGDEVNLETDIFARYIEQLIDRG